jgi:hypothetical protein
MPPLANIEISLRLEIAALGEERWIESHLCRGLELRPNLATCWTKSMTYTDMMAECHLLQTSKFPPRPEVIYDIM